MSRIGSTSRLAAESYSEQPARLIDSVSNAKRSVSSLVASLDWKPWLVLFVTGILIIAIEVQNHRLMWQNHNSGQTIWTDRELQWEIVAYGLLMPLIVGAILAYLSHMAAERDKLARELVQRRELMHKVNESESWHEMAEQIVATPGSVVAAHHAWLLAQKSGQPGFEQVAKWERSAGLAATPIQQVIPEVCEQCLDAHSLNGHRLINCQESVSEIESRAARRYCLFLSDRPSRKAALLFDVPEDESLSQSQLRVMEELGTEMALALDKVNLRALETQQGEATRDERLRIARDLHDTVGQNVSYLRLKLEQLSTSQLASDESGFHDVLDRMLAVTDETYLQLRHTLEALRTTEPLPLEEVITSYATQVSDRAGFSLQVHSNGISSALPADWTRQIAYIAREALNNVERHSAASQVKIHLDWLPDQFRFILHDNGIGFDPTTSVGEKSFGFTIMGERAQAIGAEFLIHSEPGNGTEIELRLPLKAGQIVSPTAT